MSGLGGELKSQVIIQKLHSVIENLDDNDKSFNGIIEFELQRDGIFQRKVGELWI